MIRWSDIKWLEALCWYCAGQMHDEPPERVGVLGGFKVHRDHWWPKSRGGTDGEHNIRLCCRNCNLLKSASRAGDFRRRLMHRIWGIPEEAEYLKDWLVRLTGNPWPGVDEFPFYGEDPVNYGRRLSDFSKKYNCWSADYREGVRDHDVAPKNDNVP